MNILVLQGPNLNLLGKKSSKIGQLVTLDKVNKALRRQVRNRDIDLKIFQTHHIEKLITTIQRQRNWADAIVLAPMAWARYEWALRETLVLVNIPTVQIFFTNEFDFGTNENDSILTDICIQTLTDAPIEAFGRALEIQITNHNSSK